MKISDGRTRSMTVPASNAPTSAPLPATDIVRPTYESDAPRALPVAMTASEIPVVLKARFDRVMAIITRRSTGSRRMCGNPPNSSFFPGAEGAVRGVLLTNSVRTADIAKETHAPRKGSARAAPYRAPPTDGPAMIAPYSLIWF